jgi:hypothetical protein
LSLASSSISCSSRRRSTSASVNAVPYTECLVARVRTESHRCGLRGRA